MAPHEVFKRDGDDLEVVVRIPMGHGVDSLNVAAATAVACYVLRR